MVSFLNIKYERCVLPGVSLPLGQNGRYLMNFFKDKYDIDIEYLEQVKTLPERGAKSGRVDQIFNVKEESVDKFDQIKEEIGALYVKEVVKSNEHHLYNERIFSSYFQRAEEELLQAGEISEADKFQLLGK